jgi:mevalonate kinase
LLAKTFGGSGYDIACATAKSAITYQLTTHCSRLTNAIDFNPTFKGYLYFVHLGKKQNSREGIQHYRNLSIDKSFTQMSWMSFVIIWKYMRIL